MQLSQKPFTEKNLYETVQMNVEKRLDTSAAYIHPYCLSLDSISNALNTLISMKCISKQVITSERTVVQYIAEINELLDVFRHIKSYCSVLVQFNGLSNYLSLSKL